MKKLLALVSLALEASLAVDGKKKEQNRGRAGDVRSQVLRLHKLQWRGCQLAVQLRERHRWCWLQPARS